MLYTKQREEIVREAMQWLNTPYVGWGRCKHFGADCLGFITGVFINTGHISEAEAANDVPTDYSLQIGQHQEDAEYITGVLKFMTEITESEVRPADVVMFKIAKAYTHSGIVTAWPMILHSLAHGGVKFANAKTHPLLAGKPVRFFALKDGR
jgi:cell wall-associated NlpC family hydrolase